MADYKATTSEFQTVANAIRAKGGTSASLAWPDGFASAISAIPSGVMPSGSISISANGTYDVTTFANAIVSVPQMIEGGADSIIEDAATDVFLSTASRISPYAFYKRTALETVNAPSVTEIGQYAFRECVALNAVSFPNCETISEYAFSGCKSLSAAIFSACTSLLSSAFNGCSALITASFPLCTVISPNAFANCVSLSSLYFPECKSINANAFQSCISLSIINFPNCKSIGSSAFRNCNTLMTVVLLDSSVVRLFASNAFQITPMASTTYTGEFGSIFVPASLVDSYKSANGWSYYSDRITSYVGG